MFKREQPDLLGYVWPWQWSPAEVVDDYKQIDESDRSDARRGHNRIINVTLRWFGFYHSGCGHLARGHEQCATDENGTSSEPIG